MGATLEVGTGKGNKKARVQPSMNVTPLVDVVLVLLIIFMVIAPMMVKQFWVHEPKKDNSATPESEPPPPDQVPVVLTVHADGTAWINKDRVDLGELPEKLERIFAARDERTLFFDAADDVPYGVAMAALDAARGGGAQNIAVLTESVLQ